MPWEQWLLAQAGVSLDSMTQGRGLRGHPLASVSLSLTTQSEMCPGMDKVLLCALLVQVGAAACTR